MKARVRHEGRICVLDLSGEIMFGEATAHLRKIVQDLVETGERDFVLNMLDVPWLDSSGIGEVFACYKRARAAGGEVKLVLRGKSRSMFTHAELHRVFDMYDDVAQAVAGFDHAPGPGGATLPG